MSDSDEPVAERASDEPEPFVPVIAPDVPVRVRDALSKGPRFRVPVSRKSPSKPGLVAKGILASIGVTLGMAVVTGIVGAIVGLVLDKIARGAGAGGDTIGIILWSVLAVGVLAAIGFGIGYSLSDDSEWLHLAVRRYHGRYLCEEDLDAESVELLRRAQGAAASVMASEVNELGLLEEVGNEAVMTAKLWELAQILHIQAGLRVRHVQAQHGIMTLELRSVLEPQQEALARSVAAVTRQVEALEEYARLAAVADAVYEAKKLVDVNDEYRGLLARTGDFDIGHLSAEAEQVEMVLRSSLDAAIAAGRALGGLPSI